MMGMVYGMRLAPILVRGQREEAAHYADAVIGAARLEEGPVSAIMLDDEDADRKTRRRDRKLSLIHI